MTIMAHKIIFYICLVATVALLVAGFIVPPMGVIDPSVLTGSGILLGFATIGQVPYIIEKGRTATIKHGQTEISISKKRNGKTETEQ